MLRKQKNRWLKLTTLTLPALGMLGCVEYTIETTLNPDGSGVRVERMDVWENDDLQMSPADFSEIMSAGEGSRWNHSQEVDEDGEDIQVLRRQTRVRDLASWSDLSDQVRIRATLPEEAASTVGYVTLGDVRFRNTVLVGTGTVSDGSTSYTFRETFGWELGVDILGEYLMTNFDRTLRAKYPDLSDLERGQVVGFARARFWAAVDQGYLTDDEAEDRLQAEAISKTTEQAIKLVRVRYPREDEDFMTNALTQLYNGEGELFESFFNETVPGLNLAFNTEFKIRLNMPGRITHSNAHHRDGTTLVWEVGGLEALANPIEIYAESVVGR
ncbi:hypothetical protein ACFL5A_05250 [Gemmatimonadota bacterium]